MKEYTIPFNKPFFTGNETIYINDAVKRGKISGNGYYTKKCHSFFENKFGLKKALLTTSCTDALEMAALLCEIKEGDEVILPSYTFVSTANAFLLRGAKLIFCDSKKDHPNIDENKIEFLITKRTKVIVPVHYAGVACEMEKIMNIAEKYNLIVVEDAAQAIDSYFTFKNGIAKSLGSIGHLSAFSFHETKNVISGEGGLLGINDSKYIERAEIIWEKGTNRSSFFRGEVDKYGWVDIGSSFLASDITAACLWAQLEKLEQIQNKRRGLWNYYQELLTPHFNEKILPHVPRYASNNYHIYYLICKSADDRALLINQLKKKSILAVFHYLPLHKSQFYKENYKGNELEWCDYYADRLLRLPLYNELTRSDQEKIVKTIVSILH